MSTVPVLPKWIFYVIPCVPCKCQVIPTLKSFRKRILRRKEERDASKIRNNYLTVQEREVKLQALQDRVKKKESKVFSNARKSRTKR